MEHRKGHFAYMRLLLVIALCLLPFVYSCENPDPVENLEKRTLSKDESRLIELYIKINKLSKDLKDDRENFNERISETKSEIDPEKIRMMIDETNKEPEKWLAIFKRIYTLQRLEEKKE